MLLNVRTHLRLLTCSALTALAVCGAALAPARALAARGPVAQTAPATAVTSTTATLNGTVDPGDRDTTYLFVYGTTSLDSHTAPQQVPAGAAASVSAALTGLAPGTAYRFRLLAFHTFHPGERDLGDEQSFTTEPLPAPTPPAAPPAAPTTPAAPQLAPPAPTPTLGSAVVVAPVAGTVRVKTPGAADFTPLAAAAAVPSGAVLDTRGGSVALTTALDNGTTQTATFHSGVFEVRQSKTARGLTDIFLRGPALNCARPRASASAAAVAAKRKPRKRQLWGHDNGGRFRTHGKNSVATVRGTSWVTTDTCRGTRTTVRSGAVSVRDVHRHRTVLVRAGHSYLARRR
jgi:hypothetical protein